MFPFGELAWHSLAFWRESQGTTSSSPPKNLPSKPIWMSIAPKLADIHPNPII